ncbi:hypothetical protein [Rhodococcus sp. RS1C4]|nr:hypothetical protein [Rhodococcus sp. RS1C4]
MSACEKCWTQASFDARLKGGSVADHYQRLLVENDSDHTSTDREENQ